MVAAVSIMGSALMTWSSQSFAAQQREISNQADSRINLIRENFVIEDVWFYQNATDMQNYANITIRNTGDIALTVSNVYINNTESWGDGLIILADNVGEISIKTPWEADKPQYIWIHTERGADVKQTWKS